MPHIPLSASLRDEYIYMYKSMEIKLSKLNVVEHHVDQILVHKSKYEEVVAPYEIPWYFVALIHTMESGRDFTTHLHNGDPLTGRTFHVPAGRPKRGNPPFTWKESAIDALRYKYLHRVKNWDLAKLLYYLEKYNGWGYRLYHAHVKSPYLWSYSNHYISGKYIYDGTFSDTAVSKQCGAAVILRRLEQRNEIPAFFEDELQLSYFFYSSKVEDRVDDLQRFLNTFPGISLLVDSNPGPKTSAACHKIMGAYLRGDSRGES